MKKISASYFRQQIEQHFDDCELDVICDRRRRAYTIIRDDDGSRLARLRPTGRGDEVELYSWNDDRWQPAGTCGNVMPLQDALEYITDDPGELFCGKHDYETDEDDETEYGDSADDAAGREVPMHRFAQIVDLLHEQIFIRSLLSGAIGGLGRSASEGLAVAILAAITCSASFDGFRQGWRVVTAKIVLLGLPVSLVAAAAGTLGGSIHQFIGSGVWAVLGGALAGGVSSFVLLASRRLSWLLSFNFTTKSIERFLPISLWQMARRGNAALLGHHTRRHTRAGSTGPARRTTGTRYRSICFSSAGIMTGLSQWQCKKRC